MFLWLIPVPPLLCRFQRWNCGIQEHQLHSVGRGRSGQNQAAVAPLLPEHSRWERDRAVPANTGAFKASHRCIKDGFLLLCKPSPVYRLSRTESYIIFIQPCHVTCVVKQSLFLACKRVKQKDMSCSYILLEQIRKNKSECFMANPQVPLSVFFRGDRWRPPTHAAPVGERWAAGAASSQENCRLTLELLFKRQPWMSDNLF